ncbi:stage III sporulation protein AF [uncultured Pseudoflavonifractor sp.]|uniref:stage III sporulation protein AF n=1 Tax=uncultured Pseudoflavonifractor sp. TaxID=1221379 RepID=UPI0025D499D3|nr:stage III sporulation protein AF [uncultured Pseudoflavonifractor sp.]
MIELIRDWLVGITCGAVIVALADSLSPNGTVRKIGRLTGSLVLVLAMIQPVLRIDSRTFAGILTEYRLEAMGAVDTLEEENGRLMKDIIAEETSAYILDKAEELGVICRVRVTAWTESGDYPVPDGVEIAGELTQGERAALTRVIAADLAIPAERQHYVEDVK